MRTLCGNEWPMRRFCCCWIPRADGAAFLQNCMSILVPTGPSLALAEIESDTRWVLEKSGIVYRIAHPRDVIGICRRAIRPRFNGSLVRFRASERQGVDVFYA